MKLVWPSRAYLPGYVDALERGWSSDNLRGAAAAREELARIARDPDRFLAWKQGRRYATRALAEVLRDARAEGLRYVDITTQPDNVPSQRVISANGGVVVEEFVTPPELGSRRELRFRVRLNADIIS